MRNMTGWWFEPWYTYPSEKYARQLGWFFPTEWKKCSKPPTRNDKHDELAEKDTFNKTWWGSIAMINLANIKTWWLGEFPYVKWPESR